MVNSNSSHHIPYLYDGTNLIFFNGSIYFHRAGTPKIGKYELLSKVYNEVLIDKHAAHKGNNASYFHSKKRNFFKTSIHSTGFSFVQLFGIYIM